MDTTTAGAPHPVDSIRARRLRCAFEDIAAAWGAGHEAGRDARKLDNGTVVAMLRSHARA